MRYLLECTSINANCTVYDDALFIHGARWTLNTVWMHSENKTTVRMWLQKQESGHPNNCNMVLSSFVVAWWGQSLFLQVLCSNKACSYLVLCSNVQLDRQRSVGNGYGWGHRLQLLLVLVFLSVMALEPLGWEKSIALGHRRKINAGHYLEINIKMDQITFYSLTIYKDNNLSD